MWELLKEGEGVLLECPSRWIGGFVKKSHITTVIITEAFVGHDLGDMGLFMNGIVSDSTELTPLPFDIEISKGNIDTVQPYPYVKQVRRRTHEPQKPKEFPPDQPQQPQSQT